MDWKRRLQQLVLAGGSLAMSGCTLVGNTCNANPDPCCAAPDGAACAIKRGCEAHGEGYRYDYDDAGVFSPVCQPLDAAAPEDLAAPDFSHGSNDGGAGD